MSQTPAAPPTTPTTLDTSVHCIRCGYDLVGLPINGVCPECGTFVEDSRRGTLLEHSAPEYLEKLHRGVFIILAAIVAYFILFIGTIVGSVISGVLGSGGLAIAFVVVMAIVGLGASIAVVFGWWLFSAPDPKYAGVDKGDKPRQILRASLIAVAVLIAVGTPISLWNLVNTAPTTTPTGMPTTTQTATTLIELVLNLVQLAAYATWYFTSMMYVKWIGARIPNLKVVDRSKLLMWLGPVLMTVGACVLMIGPLIALVLYWNLLDWVRKDLKAIRGV